MLCDVSLAQPRNVSVDAAHNVKFSFVFYGDGCNGADYFIYDRDNPNYKEDAVPSRYLYDSRRVYYNGEEVDVNSKGDSLGGRLVNGKSLMWKVRLYETVNITQGINPTVFREKETVVEPPYRFGTIQSNSKITDELLIPIEKNLNIELPMWMRIGDDETYRIVLAYDDTTGIVTLKNKFETYPNAGDRYSLSSIKKYVPKDEIPSNVVCVNKGITCLNNTKFVREVTDQEGVSPYIWYAEAGGQYLPITDYDYKLGLLTVDGQFSSSLNVGDVLNLWCSYVDSNFFAFDTKPSPSFKDTSVAFDGENLHFTAKLNTNHVIKNYWWDIYEDGNLVETTKEIFMGKLDYYFTNARQGKTYRGVLHIETQDGMVNQEDAEWWTSTMIPTNVATTVVPEPTEINVAAAFAMKSPEMNGIKIYLCNGETFESTLSSSVAKNMSTVFVGCDEAIKGYFETTGICVTIGQDNYLVKGYNSKTGIATLSSPLRQAYPLGTKITIYVIDTKVGDTKYRILRRSAQATEYVGDFRATEIVDYLCAANTEYTYIVTPYLLTETDGVKTAKFYHELITNPITISINEVAIYGLIPSSYVKYTNDDTRINYSYQKDDILYQIDEYWGARLDMERERGVTQNLNRVVYSGDHPKPVAVVGKNDYDSFSLSFTLGRTYCPNGRVILGTITDIQRWKDFVAKGQLVLIKSPDGEMWSGHITSHNYTKVYCGNRVEYKVNIEFIELKSTHSMRVVE